MLAFAYLGLDGEQPRLQACIERGILQGENVDKLFQSSGRATNVDVSISVEHNPDIEKLHQRLENGRELTDAEIGALVRAGKVGREDIEELAESPRGFPGVLPGKVRIFGVNWSISERCETCGHRGAPTNFLGAPGQLLVGRGSHRSCQGRLQHHVGDTHHDQHRIDGGDDANWPGVTDDDTDDPPAR